MKKMLSSIWPSIIWTLVIFVLLVMPTKDIEGSEVNEIPNIDKFVHIILYAVFSFLWTEYICSKFSYKLNSILISIFIIGAMYGLGMELIQKYFTERNFSLMDALADSIGTLIGLLPKKSPYGNRGRNQN